MTTPCCSLGYYVGNKWIELDDVKLIYEHKPEQEPKDSPSKYIRTISAKVIQHSVASNVHLYSIELKAPKFLDAEFEKHRMISSNSSSDRAIPLLKMLDNGYYLPLDIRLNQSGMQGDLLLDENNKESFWSDLKDIYGYTSDKLRKWDKVHKQHLNRYLMGFSWQNKIVTATEWENFFKLRNHPDAQPEMGELARCMQEAMDNSVAVTLQPGEWHLPYVTESSGNLEDDIKCSVARCARVSYLNHDNSIPNRAKDIALADMLLEAGHMSPFEHCATPMKFDRIWDREKGVTHLRLKDNTVWSGNFRGWIQYRNLL